MHSIWSLVVDEEWMSPGLVLWFFSALALMVGGRKDMQPIKIPVPVIPELPFWNRWRRRPKSQLVDPGSPGKWPLNGSKSVTF